MTKSTLQILKEARELISDPAKWTQGSEARTKTGQEAGIFDDEAVCWCAVGATGFVAREIRDSLRADAVLNEAAAYFGGSLGIEHFNDNRSHAEVLQAFDHAISTEEQRASA